MQLTNIRNKEHPVRLWFGFAARGLLIGLADLFPGVSGGTMALLTGVYVRFINSLASLRPALFLFLRGRIREAVQGVDWLFLTALGCGAGLSIVLLARLVKWLLEHYHTQLLCLFAGLVCYTAYSLARQVKPRSTTIALGIVGFACAFFLRELTGWFSRGEDLPPPLFALGGALAICAMMLPGISGSLLLLLLGMYKPVIGAIATLDIATLGLFAAGALTGLLLFAPLLRYSYHHFTQHTLAFLAGLTFGAIRETLPLHARGDNLVTGLLFVLVGLALGKAIDHIARFNHAQTR